MERIEIKQLARKEKLILLKSMQDGCINPNENRDFWQSIQLYPVFNTRKEYEAERYLRLTEMWRDGIIEVDIKTKTIKRSR